MAHDLQRVLREIEDRYQPLPEGLPSVAYIYEPGLQGNCLYISPSIERVLGYTREQWMAEHTMWDRSVHPDDFVRVTSAEAECARSGETLVQEYRLRTADDRWIWIRDEMTVVRGPGDQLDPIFYGVFLDVSDRKRMEAELERLALYDPLTGLPNRALFTDRLNHSLGRRAKASVTAVYFVDLDRFKRINDSLGHAAGDEVLREVARRLQSALRPEDTVARFGGDEFTILCESVGGVFEAVSVADRLQRPVAEPITAGGAELRLSASIGFALAEAGEQVDCQRLIEDADAAMYRAKERGGARAELFDATMRERAVEAMTVEQELQRGLERGELRLFYQPQVNLATGRLIGAEALLRWEHPERGLLAPDAFLHVAEESGLIVDIGAWVVGEACRRLRDWQRRGVSPDLRLSVNLGARELTHPDVVGTVLGAVRGAGIDPVLALHRGNREHGDGRPRDGLPSPDRSQPRRRARGDRRLRHRLLVARPPAQHARGRAQDRPLVRAGHLAGLVRHGARRRNAGARARAQHGRHRRGNRDRTAGNVAARARMPDRPGLPFRPAAAARGARPAAGGGPAALSPPRPPR